MADRKRPLFDRVFKGSVSEVLQKVLNGENTASCTVLNFSRERVGDKELSQLCGVLQRFTSLRNLDVGHNCFTNVGLSALCNVLTLCGSVTELHLHEDAIDNVGARVIAKVLPKLKLEALYLPNNKIGRDGIRELLLSAATSKTLRELYVHGNKGVADAVADIVAVLPLCRELELLSLGDEFTPLNDASRRQIRSVMGSCSISLEVELGHAEERVMGQKKFDHRRS